MAFTISGTTGIDLSTQPLTNKLPDANAPSGSVIQVVQSTLSTTFTTTSTSFVGTGLIASITPRSSTSKILVLLNGGSVTYDLAGNFSVAFYRQIASGGYSFLTNGETVQISGTSYGSPHSMSYLDSPATTSTVYYQPYFKSGGGQNMYFNYAASNGVATLTLMEIAA